MAIARKVDVFAAGANHMFLIGIDKYAHWPKLQSCVRDVTTFRDLMQNKYGFITDEANVLLNENATRRNILSRLDALANEVGEQDNLIIYFSGHGHVKPKKRFFWVPQEAEHWSEYIADRVLIDSISEINAHHIWVLSDSCFAGSILKALPYIRSERVLRHDYETDSRIVLAATEAENYAHGGDADEHSPFAKALLGYLQGSQSDLIGVEEVFDYVKDAVVQMKPDQVPVQGYLLESGHRHGGQLVLKKRSAGQPAQPVQKPHNVAEDRSKNVLEPHKPSPSPEPVVSPIEDHAPDEAPPVPEKPKATVDNKADAFDRQKWKDEVQVMISQAKTKQAIELIGQHANKFDKDFENAVLLLSSRWAQLSRDARSGILTFDQQSIETNKLNYAILQILEDVDQV